MNEHFWDGIVIKITCRVHYGRVVGSKDGKLCKNSQCYVATSEPKSLCETTAATTEVSSTEQPQRQTPGLLDARLFDAHHTSSASGSGYSDDDDRVATVDPTIGVDTTAMPSSSSQSKSLVPTTASMSPVMANPISKELSALALSNTLLANVHQSSAFSTHEFGSMEHHRFHATTASALGKNHIGIQIGQQVESAAISTPILLAHSVSAVLLNDLVYHDDTSIRVAIQVRDDMFNTRVSWRTVKVVATPSSDLAALDPRSVAGTCSNADPKHNSAGVCLVTFTARAAWFDSTIAGQQRKLMLVYGFEDTRQADWLDLGTVVLHAKPSIVASKSMVAVLPSRPVYPGTTFEVPVYANFEYLLETFTIDLGVDAESLQIASFALAERGWSGTTANTGSIATLSYFRDNSVLSQEPTHAMELLATMTVRVKHDAMIQRLSAVFLSCNGTSNVMDETILPDASVVVGRYGSTRSGSEVVHIEQPKPRAIFAAAEASAMVNTAILDGHSIKSKIHTIGVGPMGIFYQIDADELQCKSSDERVLAANCQHASVSAEQLSGSLRVEVLITHAGSYLATVTPFAVWVPSMPVQVAVTDSKLQAIREWQRPSDCRAVFQRSRVTATAMFGTHMNTATTQKSLRSKWFEADISATVAERMSVEVLQSDDGGVVAVMTDSHTVSGQSIGSAQIIVRGGQGQAIGAANFTVADELVNIVGLDAQAIQGFSVSARSAGGQDVVQPFEPISIQVSINEPRFTYEGDTAHVVAHAIFDDNTTMLVDANMGLVLSSTSKGSLSITNNTFVTVPYMATSDAGDLVKAEWIVDNAEGCSAASSDLLGTTLATGYAFANVSMPKAVSATIRFEGMSQHAIPALFVVPGGAAAVAGLATSANVVVELHYTNRIVDVTHDPRTHIDLSEVTSAFEIDQRTKHIQSLAGGTLGQGSIYVSFQHEAVVAAVLLELAAEEALIPSATPYPAYTGSLDVAATTLTAIGGSIPLQYEAAQLHLSMRLTSGYMFKLNPTAVSFSIKTEQSGFSKNATISGSIVHPRRMGVVSVVGNFHTEFCTIDLHVSDDYVYVQRIDEITVRQQKRLLGDAQAFRGGHGDQARTQLSATFTNGRKLAALVRTDRTLVVPGLIAFSTDAPTAISVDKHTGAVALLANHWDSATVTARIAGPNGVFVQQSVSFPCNLELTTPGDVDLGQKNGHPLMPRKVGEAFDVSVRIHAGAMHVGAFDIYIYFDSSILSVDPTKAVHLNQNKQQIGSGIIDSVVDGNTLHFSGSVDTKTLRGSQALLANIKFKALRAGVSVVSGRVGLVGSASVPAKDIGPRNAPFVAGHVFQTVLSGSRSARDANKVSPLPLDLLAESDVNTPLTLASGSECKKEFGDTNGDCVFNVNDVRFVTQYLAYRGINFAGREGTVIHSMLNRPSHGVAALDADHNSEVSGRDASFLNKVNLGIFVFVEDVHVTGHACDMQVRARVYTKGNGPVDIARTNLYFLVAMDGGEITANGKSATVSIEDQIASGKNTHGRLVSAVCSTTAALDGTVCVAKLKGNLRVRKHWASVGVSVGQVVLQHARGSAEVKFMSGLETPPFVYTSPFAAKYQAI